MKQLFKQLCGLMVSGVLLWGGCQYIGKQPAEERLLAKVHSKSLYLSELDGMFPDGTTGEDSSLIINSYVERWIREALLLHEAEKSIPSDLNIDKLVRDYRASLVRHNYEKIIVEMALDSVVTAEELAAFYERHKEQYQLESPVVRCYFIKVPLSAPDLDELRSYWNKNKTRENYAPLVDYCNQHAVAHLLEDSAWYCIEDIAAEFPAGVVATDRVTRRELTHKDAEYLYYLDIFEVRNRNEPAPLGYVTQDLRKTILRYRKIKLLEDKKEEMYELELRRNNIQVYTQ